LLQVAEMHRLLGEPDAAMRLVDRALQGRPAWPEALVLRASIRIDGAETLDATTRAAAIADLRLALAADRGSAEGARRLAEICSGEDCAAEAARVLEAQAETSPLPSDRALLLARLHLQLGRTDAAVDGLKELLAADPGDLNAADLLATIYEG